MRQLSRLSIVITILLGGLLISGSVLARVEQMSPHQQQIEGTCDELQVIFVVDQSSSMSLKVEGAPASDPDGLRFYGPAKAVETLSSLRYQTYQTSTMRVALVHFGDKPRLVMPWTVLTPTTQIEHQKLQQRLSSFFAPIDSLGNTNVLAAFQTASSLFNQAPLQVGACPARAVVVLTDGQPYVPTEGFSWSAHMTELAVYVQSYMSPPEHQIYVIGIDKANTYWDRVKPYWDEAAGDPAKVVRAEDESHMASLVIGIAEEMARLLRVTGGEATMECVSSGRLSVPPFIQQIQLTLIKPSPDLHLIVLDESGRQLEESRSDVSVTVEGYDEPIESLTVLTPRPGIWTIQTQLPTDAKNRCQIRMIKFGAEASMKSPDPGVDTPVQFRRMPVILQVVDASGHALPDYDDPYYALKMDMSLVGPSGSDQPVILDANPGYEYRGETILIDSGSHSLEVRATSHNVDGSEYVVFDRTIAAFQVLPARFVMTGGPSGLAAQHVEIPLEFATVAGQHPVQIDLLPVVSVVVTCENETLPLTLTVGQDGTYQAAFRPDRAGRCMLAYQATVDTPRGSVSLGGDQIAFEVFPTKLVRPEIVAPTGESFVATDMFLHPTGLPLEVQLVDESNNEIGPGEIGAANPMSVFEIRVLDADHNDRSSEVELINTGKPGLFRLASNTLGPGEYEITILPATEIGRDYVWQVWEKEHWSRTLRGRVNPVFFVLAGAIVTVIGSGAGLARARIRAGINPLSGYVEVFQEVPALDETTYRKIVLRRQLPKRNRAVITTARGIAGVIERVLPISLSGGPIKYILVTCSTDADSQADRARAEVVFRNGKKHSVLLDPAQPAIPLSLGFLIEKGPRKGRPPGDIAEPADSFSKPADRR